MKLTIQVVLVLLIALATYINPTTIAFMANTNLQMVCIIAIVLIAITVDVSIALLFTCIFLVTIIKTNSCKESRELFPPTMSGYPFQQFGQPDTILPPHATPYAYYGENYA